MRNILLLIFTFAMVLTLGLPVNSAGYNTSDYVEFETKYGIDGCKARVLREGYVTGPIKEKNVYEITFMIEATPHTKVHIHYKTNFVIKHGARRSSGNFVTIINDDAYKSVATQSRIGSEFFENFDTPTVTVADVFCQKIQQKDVVSEKKPDYQDSDSAKAIIIGTGAKEVIEFTDPDCSYCRKSYSYFEGRSDVKRYVYFHPLPNHHRAKGKAQYVLSAADSVKAYHDVMSGKMDAESTLAITAKGEKLQEEHSNIAKKRNVTGTPTFIINGKVVVGFNIQKIEELLGPK